MHCEEFVGLRISSLHLLLCPPHYAGRVSDDWKGICVKGFDVQNKVSVGMDGGLSFFVMSVPCASNILNQVHKLGLHESELSIDSSSPYGFSLSRRCHSKSLFSLLTYSLYLLL